ncbi:hypothetical protein EYZ11_007509 [Aspergillus tanneri]|uniref:Uncharacterized protein n=1 Tax=Aspergillus tanneri TaxID=1220188 RepID=A0A4S3JD05_9EURO|nr:hypothetical protein EYZ11_007509 [Aspergillus tanneri]
MPVLHVFDVTQVLVKLLSSKGFLMPPYLADNAEHQLSQSRGIAPQNIHD